MVLDLTQLQTLHNFWLSGTHYSSFHYTKKPQKGKKK